MEVIKCIRLEKEFAGRRGWAKSLTSLLRVRVNISAQWLIGRFVRILHSKSDYCCEQSSFHLQPQTVSQTV